MRSSSELTEVRSSVSITDRLTGRNYAQLAELGYKAVLCLDRGEFDFDADFEEQPLLVWLRALDPSKLTRESFLDAVTALEALVREHGRVVVHCHHGTGRSVAVVAGYLVRAEGLASDKALEEVAALRGGSFEVSKELERFVHQLP